MTAPYSTEISPNDHMWKTGEAWYFVVGLSALDTIKRALAIANVVPRSILDLPCGHGRVCRMLRMAFPDAHLTVSDLDRDGVDFCARQFDAEPLYSHEDIRQVASSRRFDLIWCGSLFTHLDRDRWPAFLEFFAAHLEPGGVLIFTTHGRQPIQWMAEGYLGYGLSVEEQRRLVRGYADEGFGFVSPATQAFGISVSSTSFVCDQVTRIRSLGLIGLLEGGWGNHQDVVACVRLRKPYEDAASCLLSDQLAPRSGRTEPPADRPLGHIDYPRDGATVSGDLRVSGWAGDRSGIRQIALLVDGMVIAVSPPHVSRPDVSTTYPEFSHEADRHGWMFTLSGSKPGPHSVSVEATNANGVASEIGVRRITFEPR